MDINSITIKASTITVIPTSEGNFDVVISPSNETPSWAVAVLRKIGVIIQKEDQIMSAQTDALDQAEAAAAANSSADDSAEALLVTLSKMVSDLATNQTDPATTGRITALAAAISDRAARLSTAVVAGTPAAPPPVA